MSPFLMMVVFYVNYFWLTPKCFVIGKRRYYMLVNFIMVVVFGIFLHNWVGFTNSLFMPIHIGPALRETSIDTFFFIMRDILSLAMSAAVATAIILARRIQHNEEARLEVEAARSEVELKNLRSQINPHFLLNTLNNIYALTAFDQKRAQDAIKQLSELLRHMLYDNQFDQVPMQNEVQFIESYVSLMKIRLPKQVDVQFTNNVNDTDLKIAPLLFVPLVENAFKHGVSQSEPSFVHIKIEYQESPSELICSISNSNYPKSTHDRSGHGIGLEQTQKRLDLSYPNRYEWEKGVSDDGKIYTSTIKIKL
ncbi:MAG: sensor histidine kinase [Prevotella sp.]|nr:sensor histidine kinase [Prevotella sp.]